MHFQSKMKWEKKHIEHHFLIKNVEKYWFMIEYVAQKG